MVDGRPRARRPRGHQDRRPGRHRHAAPSGSARSRPTGGGRWPAADWARGAQLRRPRCGLPVSRPATPEDVDEICRRLPETELGTTWGDVPTWKVPAGDKGKGFVLYRPPAQDRDRPRDRGDVRRPAGDHHPHRGRRSGRWSRTSRLAVLHHRPLPQLQRGARPAVAPRGAGPRRAGRDHHRRLGDAGTEGAGARSTSAMADRAPGRSPAAGPDRRADPARLAAYDVLKAVRVDDAYTNLVLPSVLRQHGLTGRDAAFATELVSGTLRRRGTYDAVLAACVDRPLAKVEAEGARRAAAGRPPAALDAGARARRDQHHRRPGAGTGRPGSGRLRQRRPAPGRPSTTSPGGYAGWRRTRPPTRSASPSVAHSHPRWVVEELTAGGGGGRARRPAGRRQRAAAGGPGGPARAGDGRRAARHAAPRSRRTAWSWRAATRAPSPPWPRAGPASRTRDRSWWPWPWRGHASTGGTSDGSTCAPDRVARRPCWRRLAAERGAGLARRRAAAAPGRAGRRCTRRRRRHAGRGRGRRHPARLAAGELRPGPGRRALLRPGCAAPAAGVPLAAHRRRPRRPGAAPASAARQRARQRPARGGGPLRHLLAGAGRDGRGRHARSSSGATTSARGRGAAAAGGPGRGRTRWPAPSSCGHTGTRRTRCSWRIAGQSVFSVALGFFVLLTTPGCGMAVSASLQESRGEERCDAQPCCWQRSPLPCGRPCLQQRRTTRSWCPGWHSRPRRPISPTSAARTCSIAAAFPPGADRPSRGHPGRAAQLRPADARRRHRVRPGDPGRLRGRDHRGRLLGAGRLRAARASPTSGTSRPGSSRARSGLAGLDLTVGPQWQYVDAAAATYTWTLYNAANGNVVQPGRQCHHRRLHGGERRRPRLPAGRLGLRRGRVLIDALRFGSPGAVTTYDLEGITVTTSISATVTGPSGKRVTFTGASRDIAGVPVGAPLVLQARPVGERGLPPGRRAGRRVTGWCGLGEPGARPDDDVPLVPARDRLRRRRLLAAGHGPRHPTHPVSRAR